MALADGVLVERASPMGLRASPVGIALVAGLPILAAAWAMLSARVVLSHAMTWDLLYNLAGAWQLQHGHVVHLDFHEPVGALDFVLTELGFELVGPRPLAFVVGATIIAAAVFLSALLASMRRLPVMPAALFVIFASLLVLMPANVGDRPDAYSFAMSYNRYGWSLLSILALILFLPPRESPGGDGLDIANAGLLLIVLFYLKITYFAAALAFLALAVMISPHIRARLPAWLVVGGLVIANALAPWNHPYLIDIVQAARAGAVRSSLAFHLNSFFASAEGYAPYAAGLIVAVWLWRRGLAPARLPLAVAGILAAGFFVLSQNAQLHGLPMGIVVAFLLYSEIAERFGAAVPALAALMVFPLFSIGASAFGIAEYRLQAGRVDDLYVVDRTQIKGLAVPERPGLLATFSAGPTNYASLNRACAVRPRFELAPTDYVETLVEAASLLGDGRHRPGRVVTLDQVNPLPFMLGWPPPRGGNLWSGPPAPVQPADKVFADADYVLIPKLSTFCAWTDKAQLEYGGYLSRHFHTREETPRWILLSRAAIGRSAAVP